MAEEKESGLMKSILDMTCPKCRTGRLFETTTFSFQKPFEMYNRCPHCNQKYMLEPGFYFGAMFVSYTITGLFCLIVIGLSMLVFGLNVWTSFALLILICIILFVWFFRISRSIWIHGWVKYNPKKR